MSGDALNFQEALARVSQMDDMQWRTTVFVQLAKLQTEMEDLTGNGRPGRISALESKVRWHDRLLWMALGGIALISLVAHFIR